MLGRAVRTWEMLIKNGFEASVMDLWKIKPINQEFFVNRLQEYDNIVTLEEQTLDGGFGSAVCEALADKNESYEICFIPDNDYRGFLKRRVEGLEEKVKAGRFITS